MYWKEKLERCEAQLETVVKISPTKTCLYPMRDWVTCVEACVSRLSDLVYNISVAIDPTKGAQLVGWHGTGIR